MCPEYEQTVTDTSLSVLFQVRLDLCPVSLPMFDSFLEGGCRSNLGSSPGRFVHLFGEGPGHAVAFPKRGVKDFVNLFLGDALPLQPSAQGSVEVVRTLAFDGWEVSPIVPMLIHPMAGLALESVLIDDGPEVLRIGTPVLRVRTSLSRAGQTQSFQIMLVSRSCPRDLLASYKATGWL